ncbi:MAG: DnaJ domain-containing protein [Verrucomicrobiae bacterium]|nr:DnaJ domain-containing protein [Verrucomicrobiae bacterium]
MDAFALFEEKRSPFLDREKLKEKFLAFTEKSHPDKFRDSDKHRAAEEKFSQMHEAYRILSQPKLRLAHLLELEFGISQNEINEVKAIFKDKKNTMELSWKIGELCQEIDTLKNKEKTLTNALSKALLSAEKNNLLQRFQTLKMEIENSLENLENQCKLLSESWAPNKANEQKIKEVYHTIAFTERAAQQLNVRLIVLMTN